MKPNFFHHFKGKNTLQTVFIVPFVLEILITVSLVGYFSYQNGQKAVENLANQLITETGDRLQENILNFLDISVKIAQNSQDLVSLGLLYLNDLDPWSPYLYKQYKNNDPNLISGVQIGNIQDEFRGAGNTYTPEGKFLEGVTIAGKKTNFQYQGYTDLERFKTLSQPDLMRPTFYASQRIWYQQAMAAKKSIWSDIYTRIIANNLTFNLVQPIYIPGQENPQAVIAVQMDLTYLNNLLKSFKIGKTGQAFIIDKNGYLIANSLQENPFILINKKIEKLPIINSKNEFTKFVGKYIKQETNNFQKLDISDLKTVKFKQEKYWLNTIHLTDQYGLNWLVIITIPESDFMTEIKRNTVNTILLSIFALLGAIIIGILTAKWVIKPILTLNNAAKNIAQGNWEQNLEINREDELGELAISFQIMTSQLQQLFQELSENKNQLSQILESLPVGVSVHNLDGSISYFNQTAKDLLQQDIKPVLGENLSSNYSLYLAGTNDLYPPEKLAVNRAIQGEKVTLDNLELHLENQIIPLEVTATPLYDEANKIVKAIAIFQDITVRKSAEKLLKEYSEKLELEVKQRTRELGQALIKAEAANQAKSAFVASMSHELRSPLNAILGFSNLMIRTQNLPQETQENLKIINRSGEYLLTLINNILDLAKIEAGKTTLNPQNFDLYDLLNEIQSIFALKAVEKGLELMFERTENVPRNVCTDSLKLRQILINLINNAIKFTNSGAICVRVSVCREVACNVSTMITFAVSDTGMGIAEPEIEELFQAFSQTESGKKAQEGTGLGLIISQKFVQLMGGNITVKSELGRGTTFTFDITAKHVNETEIKAKKPQLQVIKLAPNQPIYKILLVDDIPVNCQLLRQLLQPLGFEIRESFNGKEAIAIWETWHPDLIFMDMRMPIMDGYEATKYIKGTGINATVIIAISASVLEEEKSVILSAGCDDFIKKPFQEAIIFETIAQYLGVKYIYEDEQVLSEEKPTILTAKDLAIMSEKWLKEMYKAALNLDDESLLNLISKIPESHENIAQKLSKLVDNFQFDTLINLLEQILN